MLFGRSSKIALTAAFLAVGLIAAPAEARTTVRCDEGADLQDAIEAASSGDTLAIRGTCRGNFTILDKSLRLRGAGRGARLHAGGAGSALSINVIDGVDVGGPRASRPEVVVERLIIVGSGAGSPGIHGNDVDLLVRRSEIADNGGSGVSVVNWGSLDVSRSTIRDNGGGGLGGSMVGVMVRRSMIRDNGGWGVLGDPAKVHHSTIRDNGHTGVAGGADIQDAFVRDSLIKGNAGPGVSGHLTDVLRSTIRGNRGGGIVQVNGGGVLVRDSVIVDNDSPGDGGGIRCAESGEIVDTLIARNTAAGDGGGIRGCGYANWPLTIRDSTIRDNTAQGRGGGIFTTRPIALDDVTFSGNVPDDCVGC